MVGIVIHPIFLSYIFDVAHGVAANIFVIFFVYLLGVVVLPKKYLSNAPKEWRIPAVGAALIVIVFWYGIRFNVPVQSAFQVTFGLAAFILILRASVERWDRKFLRDVLIFDLRWLFIYVLMYIVSYIFLTPDVTGNYLQIVRNQNFDIFNYIVLSDYERDLIQSHISGFSFSSDEVKPVLGFTPAVFYFIDGVSFVFGGDVIRATMPALFGAEALIGCLVVWTCRKIFDLNIFAATLIGAVMLCGSFMRYITGAYFISSIVASFFSTLSIAALLNLLRENEGGRWTQFCQAVLIFVPCDLLIFYSYPPLLVIAIAGQVFVLIAVLVLERIILTGVKESRGIWMLASYMFAVVIAMLGVVLVDARHFTNTLILLQNISRAGIAGWPLKLISPLSILSFPGEIEQSWDGIGIIRLIVFFVFFGFATRSVFSRKERNLSVAARALIALAIASFAGYFLYYCLTGPSYQQWKLASYFPLPLGFCFYAIVAKNEMSGKGKNLGDIRRKFVYLACATIAVLNVAQHVTRDPKPPRLEAAYEKLRALDYLGGVDEIYFKMADFSTTFLPIYYVKNKILHLISASYYRHEDMDVKNISRRTPYFIEGVQCFNDDESIELDGVGCLYFDQPGLNYNNVYRFSQTIAPLINATGFSDPEPWGRWSDHTNAELSFIVSSRVLDRAGPKYINFELQPFISNSVVGQTVLVNLAGNTYKYYLTKKCIVSIPIGKIGPSGDDAQRLNVGFTMPDARMPKSIDANSTDSRQLGIGLISVSVTNIASGILLK